MLHVLCSMECHDYKYYMFGVCVCVACVCYVRVFGVCLCVLCFFLNLNLWCEECSYDIWGLHRAMSGLCLKNRCYYKQCIYRISKDFYITSLANGPCNCNVSKDSNITDLVYTVSVLRTCSWSLLYILKILSLKIVS
jgi:hypothetical protein